MKKRCDAVKANGERCKNKHVWTIPNVLSGTGVGVNDWKYGRSVRLCCKHANPFRDKKKPVNLIEGGFLQPYNSHGHGNIVLSEIIDWDKFSKDKEYIVPEYWGKETEVPDETMPKT